ncbi:hypothetical protein PMAYCL1PPCAC_24995, partial [Pristionchus mayeri]
TMMAISDTEQASHSSHLRQILADSGIDLPYCVNLDVMVLFLEEETRFIDHIFSYSLIKDPEAARS